MLLCSLLAFTRWTRKTWPLLYGRSILGCPFQPRLRLKRLPGIIHLLSILLYSSRIWVSSLHLWSVMSSSSFTYSHLGIQFCLILFFQIMMDECCVMEKEIQYSMHKLKLGLTLVDVSVKFGMATHACVFVVFTQTCMLVPLCVRSEVSAFFWR